MSNQDQSRASARHDPFPLTDLQQAYWLGRTSSFELGNVAAHFYYEVEHEQVDIERVTRAWRRLIWRHDALRLVVLPDGQQRVLDSAPDYEIQRRDLRGLSDAEAEAELAALREEMSHQVLETSRWPLFDVRAALLSDRVRLLFSVDGLLVDGWSLRILLAELAKLYDDPDLELPSIGITFREYVLAERAARQEPEWQASLAYWQSRVPTLPPRPELALARGRSAANTPRFVRFTGTLDAETWSRLQARAARTGLTPSAVLLTAYAEAIAYFSASPRFTINVALMNRNPIHPDVDDIVGELASFMLLEVDAERRDALSSRAKRLQTQMWRDLEHTGVSGLEVLRRLSRAAGEPVSMPVAFTSVLNQKRRGSDPAIGDLLARVGNLGTVVYKISQTSQVWLDFHVYEVGGGLGYNLDALQDYFPSGMLEDMFGAIDRLIARLAKEEGVWTERYPRMLSASDSQLQSELNRTAAPVPEGNLTTSIARQAAARPEALAVVSDGQRLCYAELWDRVRCLARALTELGCTPQVPIAIVMEKGWQQAVAALAVLEARLAYMPVDASTPDERLDSIIEMAGVDLVLTQARLSKERRWPTRVRVLSVESACAGKPLIAAPAADPASLAMVLLTSGSTGRPRGVMLTHQGPLNAVVDLNRRFEVGATDKILSLTPMQHDMAAYDLYGLLGVGGVLVMPDGALAKDPAHWLELMHAEGVTVWNSVPAMMQMLLDYVEQKHERLPATLRLVFLGGDFIPLDFPARLSAQVPGVRLVSLGGPTETSICSLYYAVDKVDPDWVSIPYGRPLSNQRVYVLDENLEPRPVGVPGQIYNGGLGLARGYYRDEESTRAAFIEHARTGERLYRTGDLGAYRRDGTLEILGRVDFQVKIRGHRIEPAEIEHRLREHAQVRGAVVIATGKPGERRELVAHVITDDPEPSDRDLRDFLAQRLPSVMVPLIYVRVERFPMSPNGKIDRRALQLLRLETAQAAVTPAPLTERQAVIRAAIAGVLDVSEPSVGSGDTFLELGGDSLRAVLLQSKLRDALSVEVPLSRFFAGASVMTLDAYLSGLESMPRALPAKISPRPDATTWPLSSAQARLTLLSMMAPDAPLFNLSVALRLRGTLDPGALAATLREIKRRHEVLRATFSLGPRREPIQTIQLDAPAELATRDLRELEPDVRWREFERIAGEDARRPFDLERGPLVRELLVRLGAKDHALVISLHHLVADGWSFGVLLQEFRDLYGAYARRLPSPLPELPIQYADHAAWERLVPLGPSEMTARASHWRRRLDGASFFLELPTEHERCETPRHEGALHPLVLASNDVKDRLEALCVKQQVTTFVGLLAVYALVLGAAADAADVIVGAPLANRRNAESEALIGCFVNMIPLRVRMAPEQRFDAFLAEVGRSFVDDLTHELAFDQLVRAVNPPRNFSRTPLFQAVLQLDAMSVPVLEWPGLTAELLPLDTGTARYELATRLVESSEGFTGHINYRRDLWNDACMAQLARGLSETLARAVAHPETSIHALVTAARSSLDAFRSRRLQTDSTTC